LKEVLVTSELTSLKHEEDDNHSETQYCCVFIPKAKLLYCKKGRISEDLLNFITSYKFQLSRKIQSIRTYASCVNVARSLGLYTTRELDDMG
jgi:hypothetical protein